MSANPKKGDDDGSLGAKGPSPLGQTTGTSSLCSSINSSIAIWLSASPSASPDGSILSLHHDAGTKDYGVAANSNEREGDGNLSSQDSSKCCALAVPDSVGISTAMVHALGSSLCDGSAGCCRARCVPAPCGQKPAALGGSSKAPAIASASKTRSCRIPHRTPTLQICSAFHY